MNRDNRITNAILAYEQEYKGKKSKNIAFNTEISEQILSKLKKSTFVLQKNEKVLLVLNTKTGLHNFMYFTPFVITNQRIFVSPIKRHFFASIIPLRATKQSVEFKNRQAFQIGEHDSCFGNAYVGHDLIINGKAVGLVRMGKGLLLDEKAIKYINGLATYLFKKALLNQKPVEYNWQ